MVNKSVEDNVLVAEEKPLKKKRGRKPKNKENKKDPVKKEVKVLKKRGRKPKGKVINYMKNFEVSNLDEENENIILHLPIKMTDINDVDKTDTELSESISNNVEESSVFDMDNDGNPMQHFFTLSDTPDEDNCDKCRQCTKYCKQIKKLNNVINDMSTTLSENVNNNAVKERKVHFTNINFVNFDGEKQEWQEKTDIACWWCCNTFDTPPCPLPDKYYDDKFYVFGCFCSFNCALAYNNDMNDYKTNERTSLLNYIYNVVNDNDGSEKIDPALPRQILKMFGGHLEIDEFRKNSLNCHKEYRYIMPPMRSIIPIIEEDYKEKNKYTFRSNKYVPLNNQKVQMANENLKLKRTKPLINSKYSIENTMGLKRKNF